MIGEKVKNLITLLLICMLAGILPGCNNAEKNDIIHIDNDLISFSFSGKYGALLQFIDLVTAYDILDTVVHPPSPWQVEILTSSGTEILDIYSSPNSVIQKLIL